VFSGKCKKKSEKKKKKLRRKEQSKNGTLDKMLIKLYNIVIYINKLILQYKLKRNTINRN